MKEWKLQDCLVSTPLQVQEQAETELLELVRADWQLAGIETGSRDYLILEGYLLASKHMQYFCPWARVVCCDSIILPSGHSNL